MKKNLNKNYNLNVDGEKECKRHKYNNYISAITIYSVYSEKVNSVKKNAHYFIQKLEKSYLIGVKKNKKIFKRTGL